MTIAELNAILNAARERQEREWRFAASLKGIELPSSEGEQEDPVEAAKRRAQAKLSGVSEEQLEFAGLGIEVETL